jgi:hypothetical protein
MIHSYVTRYGRIGLPHLSLPPWRLWRGAVLQRLAREHGEEKKMARQSCEDVSRERSALEWRREYARSGLLSVEFPVLVGYGAAWCALQHAMSLPTLVPL